MFKKDKTFESQLRCFVPKEIIRCVGVILVMKNEQKLGFVDYMAQRRKIKQEFFNHINPLINWHLISNIINKHYQKEMAL